ncbi:hypothetical protein J2Z21_005872 [Streptomyces griseochromogenes]|uniref:Uncharacterized protein n=1 Tax=Streptomyces griseochromogenes TaxID=68214 RepID=A0ABS4LZP9_9ACTN|nr:hypothetical protein [Streptomyces griseochromogenes]MBP2052883.1 hypothetical protein [Streptomyces griseochromogenes]
MSGVSPRGGAAPYRGEGRAEGEEEVWSAHRAQTGITRREYDDYMSGATPASGLTLEDPVSFDEPVTLSALRSAGAFHPPQSYRYMKGDELRQVAACTASPPS